MEYTTTGLSSWQVYNRMSIICPRRLVTHICTTMSTSETNAGRDRLFIIINKVYNIEEYVILVALSVTLNRRKLHPQNPCFSNKEATLSSRERERKFIYYRDLWSSCSITIWYRGPVDIPMRHAVSHHVMIFLRFPRVKEAVRRQASPSSCEEGLRSNTWHSKFLNKFHTLRTATQFPPPLVLTRNCSKFSKG